MGRMYIGVNTDKGVGRRPAQPPTKITAQELPDSLHALAVEMVRARDGYQNLNPAYPLACEYDPAEAVAARRYRLLRDILGIETRVPALPAAGGLVLALDLADAAVDGRVAGLYGYEYALFRLLYDSAGYVVGLPEIMRVVWDREYDPDARPLGEQPHRNFDHRIIRSVVARLRRKLAAIGAAGCLETRDMIGYMLRAEGAAECAAPRATIRALPRTCPTCATVFMLGRSGQQRYCSLPCFSRVQGRRHVEVHAGWKRQPAKEESA